MKRIPIAVVGLNWGASVIRKHILAAPASEYFVLAAVCCNEKEKVDDFARTYGVKGYYNLDDLLSDKEIQAVCLMTGPSGRAALIRKVVEAGKHVMTTKPVELDPDAALEVLNLAKSLGRVVHLNSPAPLPSSDIAQIQRWREEFALGRPVAVRADVWANYREPADGTWYDDHEKCPVAPIFRLGIYLINDLVRLIGKPESVSVMSSRLFTGRPTADNAQLCLEFENGTLATIFASFCINDAQWWLNSLTLNYEKGTIYRNVGPAKNGDARENPELELVVNRDGKPFNQSSIADASSEDYQWHAFYQAIQGGTLDGEMPPEEIVTALRVLRAMAIAEKSKRTELIV